MSPRCTAPPPRPATRLLRPPRTRGHLQKPPDRRFCTDRPFWKSWCREPLAIRLSQAVDHETDHGERDHGLGHLGQFLVILGQAPPAPEPAEGSFHDPPAR